MKVAGKYFLIPSIVLMMIVSGCSQALKKPVLHGYSISGLEDVRLQDGAVKADVSLILDLENPAGLRYSSDSLKIVLFRENGTIFGYASLREPVSSQKHNREQVALPLEVTLTASPLLLALSGFSKKGIDWDSMFIDADAIVKAGSMKKKIHLEHHPLKEMKGILGNFIYDGTNQ